MVTSWPARSGQTADRTAGPVLSAHLARISTASHTSSAAAATARAPVGAEAASSSHQHHSGGSDSLPSAVRSLRGDMDRPRIDNVLPHLLNADRPAQTARVSAAAAAEGVRNKPPLVIQLEAYIRKELRLLGQRYMPHRSTATAAAATSSTSTFGAATVPLPPQSSSSKPPRGGSNATAYAATTAPRKPPRHQGGDGFEDDPFPSPHGGPGGPIPSLIAGTPPSTAASHTSTALVVAETRKPAATSGGGGGASVTQRAPRLHSVMLAPAQSEAAPPPHSRGATSSGPPPRPLPSRENLLPFSTPIVNATAANTAHNQTFNGTLVDGHELGAALRPGSHERLVVFSEAYNVLVQHFSEYEDLFHTIKAEFDAAIRDGDRHKQHTRELERELATAHGYVSYIVEAETEKLRGKLRTVEIDRDALAKRAQRLEAELATSIEKRNKTQVEIERAMEDLTDGHQRNKVLADAIKADAERQASVVANLNKLRKENEHLQRYARAVEDKGRDDALIVDQLSDALKDLGYAHLTPSGAAAEAAAGGVSPALLGDAPPPDDMAAVSAVVDAAAAPVPGAAKRSMGAAGHRLQNAAMVVAASGSGGGKSSGVRGLAGVARTLLDASANLNGSETSADAGSTLAPAPSTVDGTAAVMGHNRGNPRHLATPAAVDTAIDQLEGELLKAREKAKKYQRIAVSLQKTALHQRKKLDALLSRRGDRPMTPRPSWDTLRKAVPDFHPAPETTSDELLHDLHVHIDALRDRHRIKVEAEGLSRAIQDWLGDEDLCESDLGSFSKSFVGRGTGPEVPPFLRFHGRVRNKRLRKGDVERLLSQFWADREERRRADGDGVARVQDFALDWLTKTTGSVGSGIELAYNLVDVCEKNLHDPDCSLFVDVLFGRLCEEAYFESMRSLEHLQRTIRTADKRGIGTIPRTQMFRLIRKLYPGKSQEHMLKLRFALVAHSHEDGIVSYLDLFEEDTNGNQTRFVEYLRKQHVEESQEFSVDLAEEIRASAASGDEVSLAEARTAVRKLDPAMPDKALTKTMCVAFNTTPEGLASMEERTKVSIVDFLGRVRSQVFLKRHSPKPSTLSHIDRGDGYDEGGGGGDDDDDDAVSSVSRDTDVDEDEEKGGGADDRAPSPTAAANAMQIADVPPLDEGEEAK